jgi:molybdopterin molybdotransferase
MLAALAKQHGLPLIGQRRLADDEETTQRGIRAALEEADMVVLTGGVSVGEFDYVLGSLGDAGLQVRFSRLAVKPGKPTVFSWSGEKCAFGLPGNPVSAYLMFHLFVLRAAARMTGTLPPIREFRLRLFKDFSRRKLERLEFVPARWTADGMVEAVEFHGSAHLAAVLSADGFFQAPVGIPRLKAGEEVVFSPLPRVF